MRIIFVAACGLTLTACSALPSIDMSSLRGAPATVALRVESEPAGAAVKTASGASCQTPCSLQVPAETGDVNVDIALDGFQPQSVAVHALPPEDPRENGSSALARLDPNPLFVQLEPAPPPKPAKKKVVHRKPKTAANKPGVTSAPKTVAAKPATKLAARHRAKPAIKPTLKPEEPSAGEAQAGVPATAAGMTTSSVPATSAAPWPGPAPQ